MILKSRVRIQHLLAWGNNCVNANWAYLIPVMQRAKSNASVMQRAKLNASVTQRAKSNASVTKTVKVNVSMMHRAKSNA